MKELAKFNDRTMITAAEEARSPGTFSSVMGLTVYTSTISKGELCRLTN